MCDSTKYFRCSTSSKYSRVPTAFAECRMLHGRVFQNVRTASIGTSANDCLGSIMCRRLAPELFEDLCRKIAGGPAPVRQVLDALGAVELFRKRPPEINHKHGLPCAAEIPSPEPLE